ncbi:MAG: hypothetical protein ACK4UJ_05670 [Leptonema sp. (in: bacteria)]
MRDVLTLRPIFLVLATFFIGCMTPYYDLKIYEVEKPIQRKEDYGKTKIIQLNDVYEYEDENIKIIWKEANYSFPFELTNKSEFSIKILWDDVVFVDEDGVSKRIIHSDISLSDVNKS